VFTRVPRERPRHQSLSSREREIARMIAEGHTNKTVAAVLEISSWTVSTHLRRIFAKLGVASRAAMVARLIEEADIELRHPE
jgi:DNA-binding CsgD family transcriptional regulator